MKLCCCRIAKLTAVAGVLVIFHSVLANEIRLRNEIIQTGSQTTRSLTAEPKSEPAGLILVQFKSPPSVELRQELLESGAELLSSVPENAFVARVKAGSRGWLRALPQVEWVGPYRAEHKIHPGLAEARNVSTATPEVRILIAPRTSAGELGKTRQAFSRIDSESTVHAGTILKGRLQSAQLDALANSGAVLWIEPEKAMKLFDEPASKLVAGDGGPNLLFTQSLGYDGSGVRVAVADSGLNNGDAESMHPDLLGRTPAFFHYGLPGVLEDAADEHSHGTHVAGIIAGNGATSEVDENGALYGLGVAPGAEIIAQRIFDDIGGYAAPPSFERLTRDAKRAGADIGSNSWGDDTRGQYDLSAMEFDALVRDADALTLGDQQYILEFSAGNAGPAEGSIGSPAVAKNVIATGASESDRTEFLIYGDGPDTMADFSSRGPCADGRIKPDIVAPGTYIASLQSQSATDTYAWAPISPYYQYQGGTSQAGPHASGAAAVFVQYYREIHGSTPSPALVKAALINSAYDLNDEFGTTPVPNMDEGWGRLDLPTLFDPALSFVYLDQSSPLTNGQVFERRVVISEDGEPLKITLTYTDVPGLPSAAVALVNDLDLEVVAPDGTIYRGNQFINGSSIPNAQTGDSINNVEGVMIWSPIAGEHVVRVRARNVIDDARNDTIAIDQDFALVISSIIAPPGRAQLGFDRQAYRSPDTVRIFLTDTDLAGSPSVSVIVSSQTESAGETISLFANGNGGAFTGAVVTATGVAQPDGKLQVTHGNTITARYQDVSPNTTKTCSAEADLVGPTLSGVSYTIQFGSPEVTWTSSEPATSAVYVGTNVTQATLVVTNQELVNLHVVQLGRVQAETTYYFYVVSSDAAGNTVTNNNGGAGYSFQVISGGPILLVDAWPDDPMILGAPPLTGYTSALDELGVAYDVWDTSILGSPINALANYPAVIWRISELTAQWTSGERTAVSNYLHTGGAMMIASMEILSRLEETGDTEYSSNVLKVESFVVDPEVAAITGEPTDPLLAGFGCDLDYEPYETLWQGFIPANISDTISPGAEASALLRDDFGDVVGLRWPGLGQTAPGRLVLLSFPLDAVPMNSPGNDRVALLEKILSFLVPGSSRNAILSFGAAAYQVPGRATITLGDSDLASMSSVSLTVRSTSQPGGVSVTLLRSGKLAEFTGSVDIVTGVAAPGQITAKNGDELTAEYFDSTSGLTLSAVTRIDTTPASISNVTAEPDYLDAIIYWETSEPADSLVLFGESALLGRNAYSSSLDTSHAIGLPGLSPDRIYYFKVVSRDAAGNITSDDAAGQLHTFRTLTPLQAPWADNMDSGATNWSTYSEGDLFAAGQVADWSLGVPANGLESQAHSVPHCWGSNLQGIGLDWAEMFLISPAIYLPEGNNAALQFWHSYEFNDYSGSDLEFGALQISVNNGPLQDLTSYFDSNFGWEQETVDLTPYKGKMVYLVWHYLLLGFEPGSRPGWLVDDVSITTASYQSGTVRITNNIWQGEFLLSGPLSTRGSGGTTISNAPPGEYYVDFVPVPYYQTPASQTNTLGTGGTLVFQGNYTFLDANQNGMSDAWEQAFFGTVSPGRTAQSNSDSDTMSDLAEFIVGTNPKSPVVPPSTPGQSDLPDALDLKLEVLAGGTIRLTWPSPNRCGFQLQSSPDLVNWTPASSWIRANARTTTHTLPGSGPQRTYYRLRAQP